ncbi:MAG: hypothetical protein ACREEB_13160 [Caulobacteraceae bacterium]
MPTCRDVIAEALRALKAIAPGDMPHVDQLNAGLHACQDLILELHEARGPLSDIDLTGDYVANENQRCRVQAGSTVVVTLPNAVPIFPTFDPYDYGFVEVPYWTAPGTTGAADGVCFRQPTDGARIEIVGTTNQLFLYRADINQWVGANDLRLDDELPLNARYRGPFASLLAERLMEDLALAEPTPGFAARAGRAREVIFTRPGARRLPVHGQYF